MYVHHLFLNLLQCSIRVLFVCTWCIIYFVFVSSPMSTVNLTWCHSSIGRVLIFMVRSHFQSCCVSTLKIQINYQNALFQLLRLLNSYPINIVFIAKAKAQCPAALRYWYMVDIREISDPNFRSSISEQLGDKTLLWCFFFLIKWVRFRTDMHRYSVSTSYFHTIRMTSMVFSLLKPCWTNSACSTWFPQHPGN